MPTEMTPERALIILNQCNTDGRIKVDRAELKEAVKVIHEEMRYRIPMKPFVSRYGTFICPNCKAEYICIKYCDCCGQAIDWSGHE